MATKSRNTEAAPAWMNARQKQDYAAYKALKAAVCGPLMERAGVSEEEAMRMVLGLAGAKADYDYAFGKTANLDYCDAINEHGITPANACKKLGLTTQA